MNNTSSALAVLIGLGIRIAIPLLVTALAVVILARLDRQWQSEAGSGAQATPKPECWKTQRCSPSKRKNCLGYSSALPCWQVFRRSNGYLSERCLGCPVLITAPAASTGPRGRCFPSSDFVASSHRQAPPLTKIEG